MTEEQNLKGSVPFERNCKKFKSKLAGRKSHCLSVSEFAIYRLMRFRIAQFLELDKRFWIFSTLKTPNLGVFYL